MAKQANILSFEEAKRASGASRPSVAAPKNPKKRTSSTGRMPAVSAGRATSAGSKSRVAASNRASVSARTAPNVRVVADGRASSAKGRSAASAKGRSATNAKGRPAASAKNRSAATAASRMPSRGREAVDASPESEPERLSKFAQLKHDWAKSRADRKFSKQYGGEDRAAQAAAQAQAGPRAAVYKGEMGTTHRRAARMQNAGSENPSPNRALFDVRGFLRSPRLVASAAVAACLVLTCVFLYPTAQQYYHSIRECDRLQAEYAAIEQRNEAIQSEVNALATTEGVADRAREEFGWVKAGEQAATVRGLDIPEEASTFTANIVPGSVQAPETWYSVLLDPLFGVE